MTILIFKYLKFVFGEEVRLQCLHPFLHTYSQKLILVKLFAYNVYVRFCTHIVEIEVEIAGFTLNFGKMVLSKMATLISKGSPD